ncbi:hypothetical protein G6M17_21325 [Agrobacterium tumefaciens]|uniref:hypothetical protein n=1 Tax=Rhizobium/Agrobacterium group TaxID=227290 RepID=UPI0007DE6D46|nr:MULTISPECIES: hypothetical protein [Rhizobium/Agrobacterium group]AQS63986.1 hypothetical protein B0909_16730 [Rhizobium rhizogenes]MCZ7444753.1 hypothetical protein [Rhizobium rhizogenes]NSZ81714.1 hypothetical protein [Agrobacterium tumefaciens]OAM61969.1 hypothetical protein A8L48_06345 [Rhizobium rhizogenes]
MSKSNFSDEFKRDAARQITERGSWVSLEKKAGALVIAEACEQEFRRQIHAGGIDTRGFRFVAIASTDSFAGERSILIRYSHRLRRSSKFR